MDRALVFSATIGVAVGALAVGAIAVGALAVCGWRSAAPASARWRSTT